MTSEVSINAGQLAAQQQTLQGQSNKLSEDFDDFLVLLTTQLQNQDPLSPMESTEFTNQLVSFSQVEQQINQNKAGSDVEPAIDRHIIRGLGLCRA